MKGIIFTDKECPPCDGMCQEFKKQIEAGEIMVKSVSEAEEETKKLMEKYNAKPGDLVIIAEDGELIASS